MAIGDLLGQVRAGDGGETFSGQVEGFAHDLVHALVGVALEAFHQADHDGVFGDQSLEIGECHAGELGGDGHNHDFGSLDRFGTVAGGGHALRQLLNGGQADTVVPVVADIFDDFRLTGPHGHLIAGIRQHLTESGTPCSCTENRDLLTHIVSYLCCVAPSSP